MFSKRHYEWLAQFVKTDDCMAYDTGYRVALALADRLKQDNPAFNRSRFLTACGLSYIPD